MQCSAPGSQACLPQLAAYLDCASLGAVGPGATLLHPSPGQALVERCAADGRAADVERCVLRLDLASLDFNQARVP